MNSLKKQKHGYLIHTWSDKAFMGTAVKQALPSLHGGSVEIALIAPYDLWFPSPIVIHCVYSVQCHSMYTITTIKLIKLWEM